MNCCSTCGTQLITKEIPNEGQIPFCPKYQKLKFPTFNASILIAVLNPDKTKVCLLKQNYVHQNHMVLLAGYIKKGENAETAAFRETKEELGLDISELHYVASYYHEKSNTLVCGFWAIASHENLSLQKEEVDHAQWIDIIHSLNFLKKDSLGHKHLSKIIDFLRVF